MYSALINWFTVLFRCILPLICPEPPAAVSCDRPRELELRDLNGTQLTRQPRGLTRVQ